MLLNYEKDQNMNRNRKFWSEIRKEVARMYQKHVTNKESKL